MTLNTNLFPEDSPIARNQGQVSSFRFDGENEAGVISSSKIRRASIGSAQIQEASIGSAQINNFSFNQGTGGTITLGGTNNGNGLLQVLDSTGGTGAILDNSGLMLNNGSIIIRNSSGSSIVDYVGLNSQNNFLFSSLDDTPLTTTTSTSYIPVAGGTLNTIVVPRQSVFLLMLEGWGVNPAMKTSINNEMQVAVYDSFLGTQIFSVPICGIEGVDWDTGTGLVNSSSYHSQYAHAHGIFNVAAGTHTYSIQYRLNGSGTAYLDAYVFSYIQLGR